MSQAPLIELTDVARVYRSGEGELRALDGVSLTIEAGEFVAIIGQSGSGKSTLMNILGCLDRPSEGTYRVHGVDVAELDADGLATLRRDTFGFVFQRYNLLADATAAENVEVPAIYAGTPRRRREERAAKLLSRIGLGDRLDHRPSQLSGGQQQRVSIARALMNDAPVILADEPTGALDRASGEMVLEILAELNAEGRTVILITHDPNVAAKARRRIRIEDGRIVADERDASPEAGDRQAAPAARAASRFAGLFSDMTEAVKLAGRSLRANLFRSALTLLGVVIGVAAVVAMLAIGDGSQKLVMERIGRLGTNLITIRPGAPGTRPTGEIATLTRDDAAALRRVQNVAVVVPQRTSQKTVRFAGIDYRTQIQGAGAGFAAAQDWDIASGSFFTYQDERDYAPVAVLGATVAKNLFPDGASPIGQSILISNQPFTVIGVLAAKGSSFGGQDADDLVVVPITSGIMRVFGKDYLSAVTVRIDDLTGADATQDAITKILTARHAKQDFQLRSTASLIEMATETQQTFKLLLGAVAIISLIVGGIGVMNIMLVSVTERTREIGVRMATGARTLNIMLQFNTEAVVVCGLGGLAGLGLGYAVAAGVAATGTPVAYSLGPPVFAFACAFLTGLAAGFLPARKAAHMDPVAALAAE